MNQPAIELPSTGNAVDDLLADMITALAMEQAGNDNNND